LPTRQCENGGALEKAAVMANHVLTRTTQLYDRRRDEVSLDEVERISIASRFEFRTPPLLFLGLGVSWTRSWIRESYLFSPL
jgi:hypothetical protein